MTGKSIPHVVLVAVCAATVWSTALPAQPPQSDTAGIEFFEKKIRPVLVERCYECHSATATKLKGGLRLDSREGLRKGGDSGPVIAPGEPDNSLLIKAIRYTDPELKMPPKRRLSVEEVAAFEAWVKRGAPDPRTASANDLADGKQWAFQPPQQPPLPAVKRTEWIKNPIDRFILAKLEANGLRPVAPAHKPTLIRRATFDLLGLPPKPEDIDAFLADESPDAFARVVDRLLASPQYGERWGRHWLDLVRYCDDFEQSWRYRDWVVNALNRDLPYDQFIQHQIAGDLLPPSPRDATRGREEVNADGIVATTMLSIGPWSGLDHKKRLTDVADDQIDIVSRTFLGLTVACARCHNHKFDPITTADYYGLAGVFFSSRVMSDEAYLSHTNHLLRVPLVPKTDVNKHKRHLAQVRALEKKLQTAIDQYYADFAESLLPQTARYLVACWDYEHRPADQAKITVEEFAAGKGLHGFALRRWIDYLKAAPLTEHRLLNLPVRNYDGEAGVHAWMGHAERPWWGVNSTKQEIAIETFLLPPRTVSINPGDAGGAVGWKSPVTGTVRITGKMIDGDPHDGTGVAWIIDQTSGGLRRELSSGEMPNGGAMRLDEGRTPERLAAIPVRAGDIILFQVWLRQGDAHYDITNVELTITQFDGPGRWDLTRDLVDNLLEGNPHRDTLGNAAVWHFYDMAGTHRRDRMPAAELLIAKFPASRGHKAPGDRNAIEQAAQEFQNAIAAARPDIALIQDLTGPRSPFWVNKRDDAKYLSPAAQASLAKLTNELDALRGRTPPLPCAHGIQEGGLRLSLYPGFQDAPIHIRGSYEQLGEPVPRRAPKGLVKKGSGVFSDPDFLGTLNEKDSRRLFSRSGRLGLARWIGSDSNPLAVRVMVNRVWQHHFGEGIVRTPSNFGAKGERPTHPELLDFLAKCFVESGWSIKAMHRLIMLSAAYQQSSKASAAMAGGDPENRLFSRMNRRRLEAEALHDTLLALAGRLDGRPGGPADGGPDSVRRMIYLRASRSDRSGLGPVFDSANAAMHIEKRAVSTVAPQALFLMNDAMALDAVRQLANRPEITARQELNTKVGVLYRLVYGRQPTAEELKVGSEFLESLGRDKEASAASSLRPWELYVQALLLSNEFLFVD